MFKEKNISWYVQNASVDITKIENIHLIPNNLKIETGFQMVN